MWKPEKTSGKICKHLVEQVVHNVREVFLIDILVLWKKWNFSTQM